MGQNRGYKRFDELFLFPDDPALLVNEEERTQGRSAELLAKRNERLCHRAYWYKKHYPNHKYPFYMAALEREFEISPTTIGKALAETDMMVLARQIMNEQPTDKQLKKKYWFMDWDKPKDDVYL
jgi:hypothetical protein